MNNTKNQNEDTYLQIKEPKSQNQESDENENEEEDYNNNSIQTDSNRKKGILNKKLSHFFYMRIGNTFSFFGDEYGSPLIVIGPHWPMYFCLTSIMTIGYISFFYHFWIYINIFFKLFGVATYLIFYISYSYIFFLNPGIPKYDKNAILGKPREKYRYCRPCGIWTSIEENTAHCYECNVCVEGYDHHCPWTGKCIAKNNINAFYVFLVSVLCIFCYFVTALTHAQHNAYLYKKNKKFLI